MFHLSIDSLPNIPYGISYNRPLETPGIKQELGLNSTRNVMKSMIKAAIFDLDGTIIDSTENDFLAWQRIFAEYRVSFPYEEYLSVLGAKGSEIVRNHLRLTETERESMLGRQEGYFKENCTARGLKLIPHMDKLLGGIRSLPLRTALATGSSDGKLSFIFEKVAIKAFFDVITTADTVQKGKPEPEVFLQAAGKLGIEPRECLVFEDAPLGVKAAKDAGMHCIAITTTHAEWELGQADLVVDSYQQLDLKKWLRHQTGNREVG
jgi:beta-phosphoglucomutase